MKISIKEGFNIPPKPAPSKEEAAFIWLLEFRKYLLDNNLAAFGDIIPSKKDISNFLKISTGTVQNAILRAEALGFFTSKQCIGTMISDTEGKKPFKMFSKKDKAVVEIKKFLTKHKYEKNEIIPNILEIASEIKTTPNTARLAILELVQKGFLIKKNYKNTVHFVLNEDLTKALKEPEGAVKSLVSISKENIKKYLNENFKTGDKIPNNLFFAEMFKVNVSTINSAMKELNREEIVYSRRGNYGSVFLNGAKKSEKSLLNGNFRNYKWENIIEEIKAYIIKNNEAGDKTLSMKEFARLFNVSTTTIKKAVYELSEQEILYVQKGKFGGLFVAKVPKNENAYQWIAVNPNYFE